ncbi:MAG: hypothetical protein ACKO5K_04735, partial [Armatimonadota bacterium]
MRQRFVEPSPTEANLRQTSEHATADASRLDVGETLSATRTSTATTEVTEDAVKARHDRIRRVNLLVQPALHWSVLMLVAAITGLLSTANPSLRQPILLHAVPQVLALVAGYRLRDARLGALSGASFHIARAALILLLGAWPRFSEVLSDHPAQMTWLFLVPPALGAFGGWLGSVRETVSSRRGNTPIRTSLAAGLAVIAATTAGIAPRFLSALPGKNIAGNPIVNTIPGAFPYFSESSGPLSIGNARYLYNFTVVQTGDALDAVARASAPGTQAPMLTTDQVLRSVDGATTVSLDGKGALVWNQGGTQKTIAAGKQPFSQLSLSRDGNMVAFRQGDQFQVFTPSKGTRPVEDLIRQFWNDAPFRVEDGQALAATFDRTPDTLNLVFRNGDRETTAFTPTLAHSAMM